jgi:probable O-glycosylation ligase (exosortase A-associated)
MRDAALIATLGLLLAAVLAQPFIGILLWNWIAFMNPHRLAYGLASELPWAVMVLAATLLGCLMAGELRLPPRNATTLLLVALMLCFTATSFVALGEPAAVWEKWDRSVKILLGLLLTAAMLTTRQRLHALVWVMVISLGYYGVRGGIFALATGGSYRVWGPPQTMITDNNHLAAALLISLPLMNYLRLQSAHRVVRVGLGIAMGLTLLAVVASYSRGALLGLGAVLFVLWLMSARKLLLGAGLALCLTGVVAFMPGGWSERMGGISSYQSDDSASERLVLWGISWRLALDRPLVGSGFTGPYTRAVVDRVAPGGPARAVHSIWFELLGEHGFPTFLIWAALSGVGVVQAWGLMRLARGRAELAWAGDLGRMGLVAIAAYLVSGSFLSLSYWDFYWTLLVVLAGAQALALRARTAVPVQGWRGVALATR